MKQFEYIQTTETVEAGSAPHMLVVDDEELSRNFLKRAVEHMGYSASTAGSAEEAYRMLDQEDYDLVLTDIRMPGPSGIQLLKYVTERFPDTSVVMISGHGQMSDALNSFRIGAYDYIPKPPTLEELGARLELALEKRRLRLSRKQQQQELEKAVHRRTEHLKRALKRIEDTYDATIKVLGSALDLRDTETEEHSARVATYTLMLAEALDRKEKRFLQDLRWGAYLHDIGKIGIPDSILLKPGRLDPEEMARIRTHPELGYRLLNSVEFLRGASELVLSHHESYDGGGYPHGLKGEQIPLSARLFAVADTIDAMTSDRPYRTAQPFSTVREELLRLSGIQFDPRIIDVFNSIPEIQWKTYRK